MTVVPLENDAPAQPAHDGAPGDTAQRGGITQTASITRHTMAGTSLVRLICDIDHDLVANLRTTLDAAAAAHAWVIVDLGRVRGIGSVGLSVLVTASLAARRAGGDLLLAAPPPLVHAVLRSVRLATAFSVYETLPQALTAALVGASVPPDSAVLTRQRDEAHR